MESFHMIVKEGVYNLWIFERNWGSQWCQIIKLMLIYIQYRLYWKTLHVKISFEGNVISADKIHDITWE